MAIPVPDSIKKGEVEAWKGGAILEPGWHTVVVDKHEEDESGDKPSIEVGFSNENGDIRDWLHLSEAAYGRLVSYYQACDMSLEGVDEFPSTEGKSLSIFVVKEPKRDGSTNDDGTPKMVSVVKAFAPPGKGQGRVAGGGGRKLPPSDVPGSPGAMADDDIPF